MAEEEIVWVWNTVAGEPQPCQANMLNYAWANNCRKYRPEIDGPRKDGTYPPGYEPTGATAKQRGESAIIRPKATAADCQCGDPNDPTKVHCADGRECYDPAQTLAGSEQDGVDDAGGEDDPEAKPSEESAGGFAITNDDEDGRGSEPEEPQGSGEIVRPINPGTQEHAATGVSRSQNGKRKAGPK